jgi:nitronate monooxygenase
MNAFLRVLGIELPIVQAPMSGGFTTPELVAAVSNAGGLGCIGAAYLNGEQILEIVRQVRALTDRPFAINVFAGPAGAPEPRDPAPMLALLAKVHAELDLEPPQPPSPAASLDGERMQAVLEADVPVFTFTFGVPAEPELARLRKRGTYLIGTATTVVEGERLQAAGVDAMFAQGAEAGGHRGSFAGAFEQSMVPCLELVKGLAAAVERPVIAAGGIMDGAGIAAALAAGAAAAALGTAFLTCPESGAPVAHKQALLGADADTTVITRVFSGRPARGLRNGFIDQLAGQEAAILPYPLQNAATRPMRNAASRLGRADYLSLWAGTGVARVREMPAAELVATLAREAGF